jgi:ABC-2 type transport system permease protein
MTPVFKTLLLREWMQVHRGWLILAAIPFSALLLALLFGGVNIDGGDTPLSVMVVLCGLYPVGLAMLAWVSASIQAPGLARRDEQDRSIEFWRSLPVADWQAVAAPLLMTLLLMPMLVALLALGSGLVIAALVVAKLYGMGALLGLDWGPLLLAWAASVPRLVLGMVLAAFWLSPLLLIFMAASAWLKRWGVPAVLGVTGIGSAVLAKVYHRPELMQMLDGFRVHFLSALIPTVGTAEFDEVPWAAADLGSLPGRLLMDCLHVLAELADPISLAALAISALCFYLLVLRRQR